MKGGIPLVEGGDCGGGGYEWGGLEEDLSALQASKVNPGLFGITTKLDRIGALCLVFHPRLVHRSFLSSCLCLFAEDKNRQSLSDHDGILSGQKFSISVAPLGFKRA